MPYQNLSIVLVEDNPGDVRLFQEILKEAYASRFTLAHFSAIGAALEHLAGATPDVVVLDLGLPDAVGVDAIRKVRAAAPAVPAVVLTSRADEDLGVQALHNGAQDYLVKGEVDARMLSRALRYAIERHRLQEALHNQSLIDELTGLYNRRGFLTVAGNYVKLAERTQAAFALAFVDLDGMKQINDSLGHAEGDRALVDAAGLLRACMRRTDILARMGGDEFALLLTEAANHGKSVAARLQEQTDRHNATQNRRYTLSFSIGIVASPAGQPPTLDELLQRADEAMYQQKQAKKAGARP